MIFMTGFSGLILGLSHMSFHFKSSYIKPHLWASNSQTQVFLPLQPAATQSSMTWRHLQWEHGVMQIIHRPPTPLSLSDCGWVTQTKTEGPEMIHLILDGVCFRMSNICPAQQQLPNSGGLTQPDRDPNNDRRRVSEVICDNKSERKGS